MRHSKRSKRVSKCGMRHEGINVAHKYLPKAVRSYLNAFLGLLTAFLVSV